jgi:hypothetical protein
MMSRNDSLVLAGAVLGGLLGYFAFFWVAGQGFYGLVLPGGLAGLGAGIFASRSKVVPVLCGLLAAAFGLFTEWRYAPFRADPSLGYFLWHLHELRPITLVIIAFGGLIGFWIPFRRGQDLRA